MPNAIEPNITRAASFFDVLIRELGEKDKRSLKILDFGCGAGQLVGELRAMGYEAFGCDTWGTYSQRPSDHTHLREILQGPFRLPFDSETFDVVVSTMVLEHAQNKNECFHEIYRVLKRSGHAITFCRRSGTCPPNHTSSCPWSAGSGRRVPRWWLGLWAFLGVRNEFQRGKSWRVVMDDNDRYCRSGLSYWSTRRYREVSERVFGACFFPMELFISMPGGGIQRARASAPFQETDGGSSREFRIAVLVQAKSRTASGGSTAGHAPASVGTAPR